MKNLLKSDQIKAFTLAIMIVGIGLFAFGAFRYLDAARQLNNNMAQKLHDSGEQPSNLTTGEAQMLMSADIQRRELLQQQYYALIFAGVGLALAAAGWLVGDFLAARTSDKARPTPH
jgi:hypothetical protein